MRTLTIFWRIDMMCNCEDPVQFFGGWVVVMSIHDNHGNFGEDPYDVGEG